jgi:hypothetical protein
VRRSAAVSGKAFGAKKAGAPSLKSRTRPRVLKFFAASAPPANPSVTGTDEAPDQ